MSQIYVILVTMEPHSFWSHFSFCWKRKHIFFPTRDTQLEFSVLQNCKQTLKQQLQKWNLMPNQVKGCQSNSHHGNSNEILTNIKYAENVFCCMCMNEYCWLYCTANFNSLNWWNYVFQPLLLCMLNINLWKESTRQPVLCHRVWTRLLLLLASSLASACVWLLHFRYV